MKLSKLIGSSLAVALGFAALNSCKSKEAAAPAEDAPASLVITAIPDEKVSDQEAKFQPLAAYLTEKLGVPVTFSISNDYSAAVQRFQNGEVHMAWFGGLTGVQARQLTPGARAIAQGDVDPQYKSYFIAHKSTGLEKSDKFPAEIADMSFTFGSKSSTSGRLMPTYFIQKETGKTVDEFFRNPVLFRKVGSHDATARAVASGEVQVGALSYKKYDSMVKDGEISADDAKIIWTTPYYADYNLTVHPDLEKFGAGFIDKLQAALVECTDKEVLKAFNRDKLIPAKNSDFDGIVEVAKQLDMLR